MPDFRSASQRHGPSHQTGMETKILDKNHWELNSCLRKWCRLQNCHFRSGQQQSPAHSNPGKIKSTCPRQGVLSPRSPQHSTCLGLSHSAQNKKKQGLEGTAFGAGLFSTPVQRIIHYGHDQHRGISFTKQPDSFNLIFKRRLFSFVQTWKAL